MSYEGEVFFYFFVLQRFFVIFVEIETRVPFGLMKYNERSGIKYNNVSLFRFEK
jgi:hypothetical protein